MLILTPEEIARVTPGSRWLRTSVQFRGQGLHVIVDELLTVTGNTGPVEHYVRYHAEETGRAGKSQLREFLQPSRHLPADPVEPKLKEQLELPMTPRTIEERLDAIERRLAMFFELLREIQAEVRTQIVVEPERKRR